MPNHNTNSNYNFQQNYEKKSEKCQKKDLNENSLNYSFCDFSKNVPNRSLFFNNLSNIPEKKYTLDTTADMSNITTIIDSEFSNSNNCLKEKEHESYSKCKSNFDLQKMKKFNGPNSPEQLVIKTKEKNAREYNCSSRKAKSINQNEVALKNYAKNVLERILLDKS